MAGSKYVPDSQSPDRPGAAIATKQADTKTALVHLRTMVFAP